MKETDSYFLESLDLIDAKVEKHIPYILKDLWELGSMPEYVIDLVTNFTDVTKIKKVVDFGCGKGAVLTQLAKKINFNGTGIDIVNEFINEAKIYALKEGVNERINFIADDLLTQLGKFKNFDLVIYGHDSEVLGDVFESLIELKKCIGKPGWVIFEVAFTPNSKDKIEGIPHENELKIHLKESGLKTVASLYWDIKDIKKVNQRNNTLIQNQINQLIDKYPEEKEIFEAYMQNQLDECHMIENDIVCSTWLLKSKD